MAANTSKGINQALLVIDAETKKQIALPLNAAQAILKPMVALRKWILKRSRTFAKTEKMEIGGKIWVCAYPKGQGPKGRDINTVFEDTTSKFTAGMYGDETAATFGYIAPEVGNKLVKDYIELNGGKFFKKLYASRDIKEKGLGNLIAWDLEDFSINEEISNLGILKKALVDSYGTVGKWATDAGYVAPTSGVGKRVEAKTYTADAAGGLAAVADIKAKIRYKKNIGLPTADGGVEPTYPFAYGTDITGSTLISISPTINDSILAAIQDSKNGFIAGLSYDKELGVITSINVDGKKVEVEVIEDMPAKAGKAFNWSIEEIGKSGAMAIGSVFQNQNVVRPHYEGISMLGKISEGVGTVISGKFLQPELNFASFEV